MGRMTAEAMAQQGPSLMQALRWHLRYNHFPPIHRTMLPPAREAVVAVADGDHDREIRLPSGLRHRVHGDRVPAGVIVRELHLEPFTAPTARWRQA